MRPTRSCGKPLTTGAMGANGPHLQLLLENLDFADYITLLPQNHHQMQEKLREVEQKAAETGLHISTTAKVQTERHWPA